MITKNFTPVLIEVNHSPSFSADTPLDKTIKKYLIVDTLNLLNMDGQDRVDFLKRVGKESKETERGISSSTATAPTTAINGASRSQAEARKQE